MQLKKIDIGGHFYEVEENEKECLREENNEYCHGLIDYLSKKIYYRRKEIHSKSSLHQTIAHEILHAFFY
ncbi:unnamed protein product, partial [marine sediment metagenome]